MSWKRRRIEPRRPSAAHGGAEEVREEAVTDCRVDDANEDVEANEASEANEENEENAPQTAASAPGVVATADMGRVCQAGGDAPQAVPVEQESAEDMRVLPAEKAGTALAVGTCVLYSPAASARKPLDGVRLHHERKAIAPPLAFGIVVKTPAAEKRRPRTSTLRSAARITIMPLVAHPDSPHYVFFADASRTLRISPSQVVWSSARVHRVNRFEHGYCVLQPAEHAKLQQACRAARGAEALRKHLQNTAAMEPTPVAARYA